MQYGHFDDERREYVIDRPDTPRSWSNYLGTTEYGAIITNNAGGYSFYKSAAQGRYTRLRFNSVPLDQPGRYFYLRDQESGDFWSQSWQPVGKDLREFQAECRHGTGYSILRSTYSGIASEATYFVPLGAEYEVWILRVKNESSRARRLRVYSYVEYASEWHYFHDLVNLQYSQYVVDCRFNGGMIEHGMCTNLKVDEHDFQNRDQARYSFLGAVGETPIGFDTDREAFIGPYRTYANPIVVERGATTRSEAHGDNACGVLEFALDLAPGEERELAIVMGVGRAERQGKQALAAVASPEHARELLEAVRRRWHDKLGRIRVRTPDRELDSTINVWNAYNALITFAWSRAASLVYSGERDGLGYRDTVQDILGVLPAIPEEARARLELMITGQASTGGALEVVKPFAHRPGHERKPAEDHYRSDDCLWLFNTVPAYVKETGDVAFYDEVLPYADEGQATVLGHLRRAIEFNLERSGAHGLPCGLMADWNDCLKLGQRGESVFVAFQLRLALATYAQIARDLGRANESGWASEKLEALDAAIQEHCWDGAWFIRAFREDGSIIGTHDDDEGSIFLNSQTWSVLSAAARPEQALAAMNSVKERLATDFGLMLCHPPFRKTDVAVVRATLFNPGMKENAGIFCHPQPWAVMAETLLGRGDRAYEYLRAYMPAAYNTRAEVRQIEPYVHCQSTHGKDSRRFGASRLPWLTGAVSWSYHAATHWLLGVRPEVDGLRVDPCIPASWDGFELTRVFRGASYEITVQNPGHVQKGIESLSVDGKSVDPKQPIAVAAPGSTVRVVAVMG